MFSGGPRSGHWSKGGLAALDELLQLMPKSLPI
jgi:hypothetical protein